jgi:hypothetical protein
LLNSNILGGWHIYDGWIMQETSRKYVKPTYFKNYLREDQKLREKMMYVESDIRKMGIVNWR